MILNCVIVSVLEFILFGCPYGNCDGSNCDSSPQSNLIVFFFFISNRQNTLAVAVFIAFYFFDSLPPEFISGGGGGVRRVGRFSSIVDVISGVSYNLSVVNGSLIHFDGYNLHSADCLPTRNGFSLASLYSASFPLQFPESIAFLTTLLSLLKTTIYPLTRFHIFLFPFRASKLIYIFFRPV